MENSSRMSKKSTSDLTIKGATMNSKADLLKRKVKILQSKLALKDKIIEQLEYQIRTGKLPPVENYLKPSHVFDFAEQHARNLHMVDLEIENLELKEMVENIRAEGQEDE